MRSSEVDLSEAWEKRASLKRNETELEQFKRQFGRNP